MSFEALQKEVATWPDAQLRQFQAYLVSLRHQRDEETMSKLSAKLDDRDSSRWISLEDAEKRLDLAGA
jgi:hypothetical protein